MSVVSDVGLLVPAFRDRLRAVLIALRGQGYKPRVFETWRSPERAAALVDKGASKAKGGLSMHCYGCAADVICLDHGWDCHKAKPVCKFFSALCLAAQDEGLTSGANWDGDKLIGERGENDLPHIQGVPATRAFQDAVRAAPGPAAVNALVQRALAAH